MEWVREKRRRRRRNTHTLKKEDKIMRDWKCIRTEVIEWWVVHNLLKAFSVCVRNDGNGASGAEEINNNNNKKNEIKYWLAISFLGLLLSQDFALLFDRSKTASLLYIYRRESFDEVEELSLLFPTQPRGDHTSSRVMSFLFQLPVVSDIGLRFRIKRRHKSGGERGG